MCHTREEARPVLDPMMQSLREAEARQDLREEKFLTVVGDKLDSGELTPETALELLTYVERVVGRGGPTVALLAFILLCEDNRERAIRLWRDPDAARYWRAISRVLSQALGPARMLP